MNPYKSKNQIERELLQANMRLDACMVLLNRAVLDRGTVTQEGVSKLQVKDMSVRLAYDKETDTLTARAEEPTPA